MFDLPLVAHDGRVFPASPRTFSSPHSSVAFALSRLPADVTFEVDIRSVIYEDLVAPRGLSEMKRNTVPKGFRGLVERLLTVEPRSNEVPNIVVAKQAKS